MRATRLRRLEAAGVAVTVCAALLCITTSARAATVATVPRPDHVVIVVEENESSAAIIGNPDAPYINSLAATGANMGFFAETHPSQPNYLAMYSGDTQGVTDDSCPHTFSTPSLGGQLAGAGLGFAGYSEDLPSVGYTGCVSGEYARKHSPWTNFTDTASSANQPFSSFPTDYSTLPAVSYVIPNLIDDMHDGTIAQGDAWLQNNLSGYITWAQTHNSVFVLTFDEDDHSQGNRIPTVITGQQVTPGNYSETVNHYNLLRTIEDGFGLPGLGAAATATPLLDLWTLPSGDQPPVPDFASTCTNLSCSFDASASSDPDGSIVSYSWSFGDGGTATGQTPTHTYATGGTKSVTLTAVDDKGVASSTTHAASPVAPAGSTFEIDTFNRTVRAAWGSADTGDAWSLMGASSNFSVSPGGATMSLKAGATLGGWLGPSVTDADVSSPFTVTKLPIGGSLNVSTYGRRIDASNYYYATTVINPDGSVTMTLTRTVGGTSKTLTSAKVTGLTVSAGMSLQQRLQVVGTAPTTIRARVWPTSTTEPSTWRVSATDTTAALQTAGQTGVRTFLAAAVTNAPVPITFSRFSGQPSSAPAQPLVAAFTSSCTQLSCDFDASTSSDSTGTLTGYSWTFGDGATGSGVTVSHAYITAGGYPITLTITDSNGAQAAVSHTVTATNPPPNQPPTARFTTSCSGLSCSFDGSASTDPEDVDVASYSWDFGDPADPSGATAATASHTYATGGTYTVTLTVTDSDGASGTATQSVTVGTGSTPFVSDSFARTVSGGWGTADVGGRWSTVGTSTRFAVSPGTASMTFPSPDTQLQAFVGSARTDADVVTDVALDKIPAGGPVYLSLVGRRVSSGNMYFAKAQVNPTGQVLLRLYRQVSGVQTVLAGPITLPGGTFSAGSSMTMRIQVTGTSPTTVRARAWATSSPEPSAWELSVSDASTALQQPGVVGTIGYVATTITSVPIRAGFTRLVATGPAPVTPAVVSPQLQADFEDGTAGAFTSLRGATIGSSSAHDGLNGVRLAPDATGHAGMTYTTADQTHSWVSFRGWFRVVNKTGSANTYTNLFEIGNTLTTGSKGQFTVYTRLGDLGVDFNTSDYSPLLPAYSAGVWHLIECRVFFGSTTFTAAVRLDGAEFAHFSGSGQTPTYFKSLWVEYASAVTDQTVDWDGISLWYGDYDPGYWAPPGSPPAAATKASSHPPLA